MDWVGLGHRIRRVAEEIVASGGMANSETAGFKLDMAVFRIESAGGLRA